MTDGWRIRKGASEMKQRPKTLLPAAGICASWWHDNIVVWGRGQYLTLPGSGKVTHRALTQGILVP